MTCFSNPKRPLSSLVTVSSVRTTVLVPSPDFTTNVSEVRDVIIPFTFTLSWPAALAPNVAAMKHKDSRVINIRLRCIVPSLGFLRLNTRSEIADDKLQFAYKRAFAIGNEADSRIGELS